MILPLRRAHRTAFVALALVLPALLVGAWRVRRSSVHQELPPEYLPGSSAAPHDDDQGDDLVYWTKSADGSTRKAPGSRELPEDAELMGTVRSGALALPPPAETRVLVYSLAHDKLHEVGRDPGRARE